MRVGGDGGKVLDDFLRALGLSRARLATEYLSDEFGQQILGNTDVMRMLWFSLSSPMFTHARSAIAKMCGGFSSLRCPRYCCTMASE